MVRLAGGKFTMGSESFYPEERPLQKVRVDPFWIDETCVTNDQFGEFIEATGHITFAEIAPDPKDHPGMPPEMAEPGSLVFTQPPHSVALKDWSQWWRFVFGADWRPPLGPERSLEGLENHPVTHVTHADAGPTQTGRAKACQPRQSLNLPHMADMMIATINGATSSRRMGKCSPITGRGDSRMKTQRRMAGREPARCAATRPMIMVFTT